jgi:hypothetical protein
MCIPFWPVMPGMTVLGGELISCMLVWSSASQQGGIVIDIGSCTYIGSTEGKVQKELTRACRGDPGISYPTTSHDMADIQF